LKALAVSILCAFLVACDPFGSPREEIGDSFSADSLKLLCDVTEVVMPESAVRLCFYDEAGRDPGMFAKLSIPGTTIQEFRDLNKGFDGWSVMGDFHRPSTSKEWWKPGGLSDPIHLQHYSSDYQDCRDISVGYEDGVLVIYLSWFTT